MNRLILLLLLAGPAPPIRAELPPLIPREVLFGNPEKALPQISPNGNLLAYLAPANNALNVWVRAPGDTNGVPVTSDRRRGIRAFFWQADSQHIIYMQDQDGDENWHFYQAHLLTGNTRDLTPFQGVQARLVAVDPAVPDEMLVALNLRDRRRHEVFRVNLKTGAVTFDTENTGDTTDWVVDNRLQVRAALSYQADGGREIRVRPDVNSIWRRFQRWGPDETFGGIAGFTTNNNGVWLVTSAGADTARLQEVDLATGLARTLAEDKQYDAGAVMIHPRTHQLEAVEFVRARSEWRLIDESLRADFDTLRKVRDGDFQVVSRDQGDRIWIVSYLLDDGPTAYYGYDRANKKTIFLFSNRPALEKFTLAKMSPVSFAARDGLGLNGYLTLPPGLEPKKLPLVLVIHGGPWSRDTWGLNDYVQWLANRGYAVLQVNFRGSTGYGKKFLNAGDREWGGKMQEDLLDGRTWAVQQGCADASRVAVFGGSYGGYAVLAALAFTPDEFACGVDLAGPPNLLTLLESIPPYFAPMKAMFDKRLGSAQKDADFLRKRSPIFQAGRIKKPLLIGQAANDPRVKQAESDEIAAVMRQNNQPVEYIVLPDEGRGFARPESDMRFLAAVEAFLARHLGGRAQPPSENEKWEALRK